MQQLRTEYPFTLPKGFLDADGVLHREGTMRLATARDELEPLNDPKVTDADDPYLTVIVLARVITRLGTLTRLSPRDVEGLFAADLAHLQDVYGIINYGSAAEIERLLATGPGATAPLSPSQLAAGAPAVNAPTPPGVAPSPGDVAAAATVGAAASPTVAGASSVSASGASPVTDAARSMVDPPPSSDDQPAESFTPRSARRGRIEEIGRSSGPPGSRS
jgi:hypothetical protein